MTNLGKKIKDKSVIVGVIGLGYVGLPLALAFAEAGFTVIGFDIQQKRVDLVTKGESYIVDIKRERLRKAMSSGLLKATVDQEKLKETDAICICVPTPLTKTKDPDLSYVIYESEQISKRLHPGQLIILESTTYPGTTQEVVMPILKRSGLKEGQDFWLAYSPERVDPGSKNFNIKNTPKVVGGIDEVSTDLACLLYSKIVDRVIPVSNTKVAEMTKIFENVFRDVNIALVNELTLLCEKMGVDVWEVIDAATSKPFGYMPFYPGPGIGGHCIPLDPYYLANKAREYDFHTKFIELAADINEQMPYYTVVRISDALNKAGKNLSDSAILVLGVAYKRDIEDIRESPALKVIKLLKSKGVTLNYNDPYVAQIQVDGEILHSIELNDTLLRSVNCVVITTDHTSYDYKYIADRAKLIFDTRGATRKLANQNIVRL